MKAQHIISATNALKKTLPLSASILHDFYQLVEKIRRLNYLYRYINAYEILFSYYGRIFPFELQ